MSDIALEQLARNKAQAARNNRAPQETLLRGGYARCGYCGGALVAPRWSDTKGGTLHRCCIAAHYRTGGSQHGIAARKLDAAVWAKLEAILTGSDVVGRELARLQGADNPWRRRDSNSATAKPGAGRWRIGSAS